MNNIIGADYSHWNKFIDKTKPFAICKCTQGLGYLDPTYKEKKEFARKNNILFGAYHFADSSDPIKEADHFLNNIGDLKEGELVALDAESGQSSDWCKKFLDHVSSKLGFKCLLYSPVGKWNVALDYPLWIMRYGRNNGQINYDQPPNIGKWKDWTIWQFSSANGIDLDLFRGTIDDLKKYGKPKIELHEEKNTQYTKDTTAEVSTSQNAKSEATSDSVPKEIPVVNLDKYLEETTKLPPQTDWLEVLITNIIKLMRKIWIK